MSEVAASDLRPAALADAARPIGARVGALAGRLAAVLRDVLPNAERDERLVFLAATARTEAALEPPPSGADALARLADAFGLTNADLDLLTLASLPDEHEGFCHVLRSLHPRGEPRATVALASRVALSSSTTAVDAGRWPFVDSLLHGALARSGCIALSGEAPMPERSLVAADSLWAVVRGIDVWPAGLEPIAIAAEPFIDHGWAADEEITHAIELLRSRMPVTIVVTADDEDVALERAFALAASAGVPCAALSWPPAQSHAAALLRPHAAARGVVPALRFHLPDDGPSGGVLVMPDIQGPLLLCMRAGAMPIRGPRAVSVVAAERLRPRRRENLWRHVLPELADAAPELAARYRIDSNLAAEVATDVRTRVRISGADASTPHVAESIRVRTAVPLTSGVTIVRPVATWNDLVLRTERLAQLQDAVARLHGQSRVLDEWRFLAHRPGARGVRLLFIGPPGTGKTLSAEVLASALGVDLIVADVSRLVSKWIGETPKNLGRIFDMAERSTAVILFDEADALFGKRTEVTDAHDRYANLETAYLLSRLERFEGLAVLASNLRQNIDPGFLRRLEFIVEFEEPGVAEREALWRCHVPADAPLAPDVDFAELAAAYRLTGALIRNAAVAAAFLAASDNGRIARRHIARAVRREYEKAGKAFPGDLPDPASVRG